MVEHFDNFDTLFLERSSFDMVGCIGIYSVSSKKRISLRHIAHHYMRKIIRNAKRYGDDWHIPKIHHNDWKKINKWNDIWTHTHNYFVDDEWLYKYGGMLKRGMMISNICEQRGCEYIMAFVEDLQTKRIYIIDGHYMLPQEK